MDIIEFAYQIISLHEKNTRLLCENNRLHEIEEKYSELLKDTLKSQSVHSTQTLDLMIHDGKFSNTSVDLYYSHIGAKTK